MYVIIVYINIVSIHVRQQAYYQPVEQHHCKAGRPIPIGVECICNKAKSMSLLVSKHFNSILYKVYTCFHLAPASVVVC